MTNLAIKASALDERAKIKFQSVAPNKFKLVVDDSHKIVIDGNDVYVERINKYPKTCEECCEVLGIDTQFCMKYLPHGTFSYKDTIIYNLQELLICRDAYWKIAGEERDLGKPWKPDWKHGKDKFYCASTIEDEIVLGEWYIDNKILAFPTEEMRDAFYENFKELIELVKELL